MKQPFTESGREALLREHAAAARDYNAAMDGGDFNRAEEVRDRARLVELDYFERLPRLSFSCCPFDGKPLYRSFDPYGFDGLWWRCDASPIEPPSCPHFCLLRGAVNLNSHPPRGGEFTARIGPGVPYVIPRILE